MNEILDLKKIISVSDQLNWLSNDPDRVDHKESERGGKREE
jgi:hypothetical protein